MMESTLPLTDEPLGDSIAQPGIWHSFFHHWPDGIPQRGVLVSNFDEQIPFRGFLASERLLCLERTNPDPMGSRSIIIPYANIAAVKLIDVFDPRQLRRIGFRPVSTAEKPRHRSSV